MRPYLAPADALVPSIGSHLPFVRSGALASAYANLPASPAHNNVPPELVDEQLKSLSAMVCYVHRHISLCLCSVSCD
jgi:hypothetical protein